MTNAEYAEACRNLVARLSRYTPNTVPTGATLLREIKAVYDKRPA